MLMISWKRLLRTLGAKKNGSDHFSIEIRDIVDDPLELRKMHSRRTLALVGQKRTRTYSKCSGCRPGTREDMFLVGRNENNVAFAHAISSRDHRIKECAKEIEKW